MNAEFFALAFTAALNPKLLAEPRLGLAMLVGVLIGLPGAAYITG
jgi:hypothetical protein